MIGNEFENRSLLNGLFLFKNSKEVVAKFKLTYQKSLNTKVKSQIFFI